MIVGSLILLAVVKASSFGFDPTDATRALQAAVDFGTGPVRIEFADGRFSVASPAPAAVDWRGRTIELSGTNKLQEIKGVNQ